jgi:hypothetical protein
MKAEYEARIAELELQIEILIEALLDKELHKQAALEGSR